jgi:hypothetical protein
LVVLGLPVVPCVVVVSPVADATAVPIPNIPFKAAVASSISMVIVVVFCNDVVR